MTVTATVGTPGTAVAPSLTVEITATIKVRQTLDLVEFFTTLPEPAREDYRTCDLAQVGIDHEWERPVGYLWPTDEAIPYALTEIAAGRTWGDITDSDVTVRQTNNGPQRYGRAAHWTEDDFAALCAAVPWLEEFHRTPADHSPEDQARIPGPNDHPLF